MVTASVAESAIAANSGVRECMARSIVERAAPAGDDGWRRGRRMARDLRGTMRVVDFVQFDAGYERR